MVVAVAGRTDLATPALSIYLAGYAITNLGAFAAVAALPGARTIDAWAGSASRHRWAVLSLVVCLLGLVGTPPTAVFIGKLAVFSAAGEGGLGWLVVLAAVNTVASLFYYLRWIIPAFQPVQGATAGVRPELAGVRPARPAAVVLHACAVGSVALGIGSGAWLALVG
jgi:NADH-quinone oxidoreductase subunit N